MSEFGDIFVSLALRMIRVFSVDLTRPEPVRRESCLYGGLPVVAWGRLTKSRTGGLAVQLGPVLLVCQHSAGQILKYKIS